MARIPLRAYNREIENLIERGQIEEAIAHCKNILKQFPKHIETYRLLGKTYLESQRYTEAADILQRVLSVMPDDFVCQLGMSIIREDEGNLDAAIWHMERAYEVQPFNRAVQDELRRLYGRRDGVEPPRVRLTRGALVRMYARGDLYPQAIAEIRAALAEDHNRIDLLVLLARMYYLSGQKVEATEICSSLIGKLPYCLEANRILMEVLPETSRAEDAHIFQQRVFSLDPYAAFISPNSPTSAQVPDQTVMVERVDWQPSMVEGQGPDWARTIGVQWEETNEEALPDWLNNIQGAPSEPAVPIEAVETPQVEPPSETETGEEVIPEFLKEAGWEKSQGIVDESAVSVLDEMPEGEEEVAEAEIPDWLKSLAPEQAAPGQQMAEAPEISEEAATDKADLEWLEGILPAAATGTASEIGSIAQIEDETTAEAQPADETPDWLSQLGAAEPDQTSPVGMVAAWGEEETLPTLETPGPSEAEEKIPDWLSQIQAEPEETVAATQEPEPSPPTTAPLSEDEFPSWLDQGAPAAEEATPQATGEEFQWQPGTEEQAQPKEALPADEEQGPLPGELPEWLTEVAPGKGSEVPEETPPPLAEPASPLDLVGETPYSSQESVPDWLKELTPEGTTPTELEIPATEETTSLPAVEAEFEGPASEPTLEIQEPGEEVTSVVEPGERGEELPEWLSEIPQEPTLTGEPVESVSLPPEMAESINEPVQPEVAETQPAQAATPNLEDMDSALAWMEALAARQGADTETLKITSEEQRTEVPPDWIRQQMTESPESQTTEEPIAETAPEAVEETSVVEEKAEPLLTEPISTEIPTWLTETSEETVAQEMISEGAPAVEPSASELPSEEVPTSEQPVTEMLSEGAPVSEQPVPEFPSEEAPAVELPVSEMLSEGAPVSEQPVLEMKSEEVLPTKQPGLELPSEEVPVSEQPAPTGLPGWLAELEESAEKPSPQEIATSIQDTQPVKVSRAPEIFPETLPEPAAEAVTPPTEPSPAAMPAEMGADEAFAWLESLASRQGAEEETLITKPEERVETPPEWVETATSVEGRVEPPIEQEAQPASQTPPTEVTAPLAEDIAPPIELGERAPEGSSAASETRAKEVPAPAETAEEVQIPEWLRSYEEDQQKQPPVWEPTTETITPEAIPDESIPEWLRKGPDEPVTPTVEVQPVLPSRQDEELASWIKQLDEIEAAPAKAEPVEIQASTEWLPEEVESTPPVTEIAPLESTTAFQTTEPIVGNAAVLDEARRALNSGDIPTALDSYNTLVNSNDRIDETIHDLREALSRYPADVMIWQTLGDAYIRGNRVQEALDAYTKAEELLQ